MKNTLGYVLAALLGAAIVVGATDAYAGKYPRETVVKVEVPGPWGGSGSAVVLQPGLLLTARHVTGGTLVYGTDPVVPIGAPKDPLLDLAALRSAAAVCPCVEFAESDAELDEVVTLIGWPHGVANHVNHGEAQGIHEIEGRGRHLIVAVQVEGGTSGGGAFVMRDGRWQLVGIVVAGSKSQTLVVPISEIRKWLEGRE